MTTAQSFLPDFVVKQGLVNPSLVRGTDFEVYTGAMKADDNAPEGRFVVNMVGSSTVQDLQGDIMALSALDDMTRIPENLTVWLNHSYSLPEDLYGSIYQKPYIISSSGIADLHLSSETESSNPRAMQTYNMISKGRRRLGCSIGCQVLDYDIDQSTGIVTILHVGVLEWSVVGIPASQRCWVEVATKSLFERSLLEGQADKALQLAPAVRGMYWRAYDSLVKHVESTSLRNDLERVRQRDTAEHRIMCMFNDGETNFVLTDGKSVTKSLKREEVGRVVEENLVTKSISRSTLEHMQVEQKLVSDIVSDAIQNIIDEAIDPDMLDSTKSVSGNTSFPLMDIGTEWTGSKAEKQIFAYAKNDDGEINVSKAKACFLYYNPSESDTQKGFKMPYVYIVDGSPKIVPKGVQACAGVLSGGMGGVDAPGDQSGMKAKVKTMYGRINSQFNPDPKWEVPWEKDEKSVEDEELTIKAKAKEEKDGIADSNSDSALNRQDLEEKPKDDKDDDKSYPKASDVKVSKDGTHEACTGQHSHPHSAMDSQGGDQLHEHNHSHSGDASHSHSHDTSKSLEVDNHHPGHEHTDHHHTHSEETTESEITKAQDEVPTQETPNQEVPQLDYRKALLNAYNNIGKELGFEAATLDIEKQKALVVNQDVITAVSQIDNCADYLMRQFGIPDIDEPQDTGNADADESTEYQAFPRYNSLDVLFAKALNSIVTKEGRELSEKNKALIKAMHDHAKSTHDMCASMHPGSCTCSAVTVDEATDEARMQGEGQPIQQYPGMQRSIEAIELLTKSLESMTVKTIVKSEVDAALDESHTALKSLREEQRLLIDNIKKLKEMPLGRPTTLVGRSVEVTDGVTTFDELKSAGVNLLEIAEEDLEVKTIGNMKYRLYPKGYKAGQRKPLTEAQKTYMSPLSYYPYEVGSADVLVPVLDEMGQ